MKLPRTSLTSFIAVIGALVLAAIVIPNFFFRARTGNGHPACINQLRQMESAKEQWALENHAKPGDGVSPRDIASYLNRKAKFPSCPQGGTYTLGKVGETPRCSHPSHVLP